MTEVVVLQQSPSHFPSASSSSSSSSTQACAHHDDQNSNALITNTHIVQEEEEEEEEEEEDEEDEEEGEQESCGTSKVERKSIERERQIERERDQEDQVSVLELLLAAFRRSLIGPCSAIEGRDFSSSSSSSSSSSRMEIGWPSNVRHIAHVTFDRFNGFLGLPVEFEPEVPRRPPSASANVFGVSTESMQLSFDSRGNSVPTILLMMQRHLYSYGGLQAEGIFRINADNSQEEYVRDQLNGGVIPNGVDVHCLAGLIKAWFRELPRGLLDSISPEEVMQSQSEEDCIRLVRLLPPTEAALLDWAINLMADVAQMEHLNKMNARNVAMVFAPNMTQMDDPLTALMYAVQVMNFLKTLIVKTLRERQDSMVDTAPEPRLGPSDEDGHQSASQTCPEEAKKEETDAENEDNNNNEELGLEYSPSSTITCDPSPSFLSSIENIIVNENRPREAASRDDGFGAEVGEPQRATLRAKMGQSSSAKRASKKAGIGSAEKGKKAGILGRINSRKELVEAWR